MGFQVMEVIVKAQFEAMLNTMYDKVSKQSVRVVLELSLPCG